MTNNPQDPLFGRYREALESVIQNDKTYYNHHEPRPYDDKVPKEDGGTIWMTPRQVAERRLKCSSVETEKAVWAVLRASARASGGCGYRSRTHEKTCLCTDCENWKAWEALPEDVKTYALSGKWRE